MAQLSLSPKIYSAPTIFHMYAIFSCFKTITAVSYLILEVWAFVISNV